MIRSTERIYDEYLVISAQSGDRVALDRLIKRWQPRFLRHAGRLLGDGESARDPVQEAWVDILRGLNSLADPAAFPAWAFRIVSRRARRPAGVAAQTQDPEALETLPASDDVNWDDFSDAALTQAMSLLPGPQRAALALFYLEDMSVAEIAVALDVPPGTVKTRLMHARMKLRAVLTGDSHGKL